MLRRRGLKHWTQPGAELAHYQASVMHKSQEQWSKSRVCPVDYFPAVLLNIDSQ